MNNNTQNEKIKSISEKTLVVGIDVGSERHYARAFDFRNCELSKGAFAFCNDEEGFEAFRTWVEGLKEANGKEGVVVGMEPTGHYWFNLGEHVKGLGMRMVHVNPHHVRKTKELDDNSPSKSDRKDPKVIAGLVNMGRYWEPYMPEGEYAEIRKLTGLMAVEQGYLTRLKNRLARWLSIHFPNYRSVYANPYSASGLMVLKAAPLPSDIEGLGEEGVNRIWRGAKVRGVGMKKARELVEAARHSVGSMEGAEAARLELGYILEDYERHLKRLESLTGKVEEKLGEVANAEKLLGIKGIGLKTVAGFVAEVGDITRFESAKQVQKLAGLAVVSNSSGKHEGESHISYRGRKRLRYVLYEAAVSVVAHNEEFGSIHEYYTTRAGNPLKKMQSIVAVACKLIRVFFAIMAGGADYDAGRMLGDIRRPAAA